MFEMALSGIVPCGYGAFVALLVRTYDHHLTVRLNINIQGVDSALPKVHETCWIYLGM